MACVVAISRERAAKANELQKSMMQAGIDMAAGRSSQDDFDSAWLAFHACFDPYQPSENHSKWLRSKLRDFYAAAMAREEGGLRITYRHKSLPKRKSIKVPGLAGLWPESFYLDDVSGKNMLVDVTAIRHVSGITEGPFHLTVIWKESARVRLRAQWDKIHAATANCAKPARGHRRSPKSARA